MEEVGVLTSHSQERDFLHLFGKSTIYEIPLFQRAYKWTWKKQLEGLVDDFDEIIDEKKLLHFFGAIIVQRMETDPTDTNRFEVIDGQQRLTTLFLFVMAGIFHLRIYDPDEAVKFFKRFLIDPDTHSENSRLQPSLEDRGQLNWIFENIITQDFDEKLREENIRYEKFGVPSNPKIDGCFRRNYTIFKNYLKKKIEDFEEKDKGLKIREIIIKILSVSKVVNLVVKNPQYGPIIFDKLNSGQEEMNIGELVKNFIFAKVAQEKKNLDSVKNFHDTEWTEFIGKFKDNKSAESYFFPLSLISNPNTKTEAVYKNMTAYWNKNEFSSEQIMEYLKEYQAAYNALSNREVKQYIKPIQEALINLSRINLSITTYPFVMQILKRLDDEVEFEDTALEVLKFLESFLVRRAICDREPTGLHAVFKQLWNKLEKKGRYDAKTILEIINESHATQKPPDDEDFIIGIKKVRLAGKKIREFMLEEYDKSFGSEIPICKKREVEHVLPKNYIHWKDDYDEPTHELLVDTFANLVFLTDKVNKEVSNKCYSEKREAIRDNAMFGSTRYLFKEYETWKPEDIRDRANKIADWALVRWKSFN